MRHSWLSEALVLLEVLKKDPLSYPEVPIDHSEREDLQMGSGPQRSLFRAIDLPSRNALPATQPGRSKREVRVQEYALAAFGSSVLDLGAVANASFQEHSCGRDMYTCTLVL